MIGLLLGLLALTAVVVFLGQVWLRGSPHHEFLEPRPSNVAARDAHSPEHLEVVAQFRDNPPQLGGGGDGLRAMREQLDSMGRETELTARVTEVDVAGVPAEWVCAPGVPPDRRLLYIHGGGFTIGSPLSHRPITQRISSAANAAVLAIDYRLLPEHSRRDCVEDCQIAYRWILENGPAGLKDSPSVLFVAGDSAGGNLTLVTIAWARDAGLRMPDAAIALSPATDGTFSGPSLRDNVGTDPMLGPALAPIAKVPIFVMMWMLLFSNRMRPANPLLSPMHGDLSNLPPVLVQVSLAETLLDDAVRWANKARAAGTDVEIEAWPHMVHVWQAFVGMLPEAEEAFQRMEVFLARHG